MFDLKRIVFVGACAIVGCEGGAGSETQRHTIGDEETMVTEDDGGSSPKHDATTNDASGPADVTDEASRTEGARDCTNATALGTNTVLRDQSIASTGTLAGACIASDASTRFYRYAIAPHTRARFVVTPTSMPAWRAVVRIRAACSEQECVAADASGVEGAPVEITIENSGDEPIEKIIAVSPDRHSVVGHYELAATSTDLRDAAVGDASSSDALGSSAICDAAIEVAAGTTLPTEDPFVGTATSFACERTDSGRPRDYVARFYRVSVAPGDYLRVVATPSDADSWSPAIFLLGDCTAASCAAQLSPFYSRQSLYTASTVNRGTSPVTLAIAVGMLANDVPHARGTFSLRVTSEPAAQNAMCEAAAALASGARLIDIPNSGGRDVLASCERTSVTGALYYRVHVPAGASLTARGTRVDGDRPWDLTMRLFPSCGATATCLASSALVDAPSQLTYRNEGDAAADLVLATSGEYADARSNLAFEVWRDPFDLTRDLAMCEEMTGATSVLEDPSYSPRMPLPFAFPFMGETMIAFASHGTGRLALFPRGDGAPDGQYGDMPIPAYADNLAATIAPFWTYAWPAERTTAGGHSDVVMKTFDAGDRHVTFEFRDWSFLDDPTARLTYQVRLYPSGRIEYHYCSMRGARADLVTGGTATVGVQSTDGFRGVQIARHTPGSIAAGSAFRLVPAY